MASGIEIALNTVVSIQRNETPVPQSPRENYIKLLEVDVYQLAHGLKTEKAAKLLAEIVYNAYQAGVASKVT